MKAATIVGVTMLLIGAAAASTAFAEEPVKGNLLLKMTQPPPAVPADSIVRDDLRELPTPRGDKLSDAVRVDVRVGDPRCLPGEDVWGTDSGLMRPRRRPR